MRSKMFLCLFLITFCINVFPQTSLDTVNLDDLRTPNSPGFQLLDASPSSIERPTNPKEFALSVFNKSNNGSVLPKNFAIEVAPFWFFKPKNETVFKYLNIETDGEKNFATGILRKLSLSIASVFNDSISGMLLANTNYVSFGARTNILTIRSKSQNTNILVLLNKIHDKLKIFKNEIGTDPDAIDSASKNDSEYKSLSQKLKDEINETRPPLFQLDAAYAYSGAFTDNKYSSRRFNKSGFWLTGTLSTLVSKKRSDIFSFVSAVRFFRDNILIDTSKFIFERRNSFDFGGRIEYTIGRFTISVEHLQRRYSKSGNYNSERTVGLLQYKLSEKLYVMGTYGKNFGEINNVFTLLGLNWGFGSSPLSIRDK